MTQEFKVYYPSEIGLLEIIGTAESIRAINFVDAEEVDQAIEAADPPPAVAACLAQLDEYFKGQRRDFSLNLEPAGTAFQQTVWQQLTTVPYGRTVSYLDVARQVGNEKAVRAVGAANGQNPIVIVVPCHRVVGSNGQLTGYGGGLWRKAWLLEHEKRFSSPQMALF
ncbi:MAG: methylated-DNA--[protein]-cysteine S-methyltransferase [Anaerolineae bacterium]|nr:methylated-DNA--[protein]-cysteine S-methyltransferase [Anaerolineae bacterium]